LAAKECGAVCEEKIKYDDVYATLSLSPSIVARGRRDRALACCSVLLLEPSYEFSASLDSSELQIFVGFRCTFCRGKNLSGWNVEKGVYKEIFIYRDWSPREREKEIFHQ